MPLELQPFFGTAFSDGMGWPELAARQYNCGASGRVTKHSFPENNRLPASPPSRNSAPGWQIHPGNPRLGSATTDKRIPDRARSSLDDWRHIEIFLTAIRDSSYAPQIDHLTRDAGAF